MSFNVADAILGVAAKGPDRPALETPEVAYTYGGLAARASQCARYLARHEVRAGDRVGIALAKPDQTIVVLLAVWMLGATCVVLDFRLRPLEKAASAEQFGLRAIVEANAPAQGRYTSIAIGTDLAAAVAAERADLVIPAAASYPAAIQPTSGTTGKAVGLVLNHHTIMHFYWILSARLLGFDRGPSVHALPLFYSSGLFRTISQLLDGGVTHILPMLASVDEIAEKVLSTRAYLASLVPPQLQGLVAAAQGTRLPLFPDLRVLTSTGSKTPAELAVRAYRELSSGFRISYGASVGGAISVLRGEDVLRKPDSVGRPNPECHLQITDLEWRPVARGETGLIRLRGPSVADDIIGDIRDHSDRMVDGWAVPGDMGYLDDEGFLFLTGRASDMMIRKGVNVFPREIEDVLEAHVGVVEAAVVGYPSVLSGQDIAAFVTVRGEVSAEQVADHARRHLVADKRPRIIRIVDELPRNDAGKVQKRRLLERLLEEKTDQQ